LVVTDVQKHVKRLFQTVSSTVKVYLWKVPFTHTTGGGERNTGPGTSSSSLITPATDGKLEGVSENKVICIMQSHLKVGTSGYGNLQTMKMDKWATSKSTQLSTKIWVKLLLLLENALKLNLRPSN